MNIAIAYVDPEDDVRAFDRARSRPRAGARVPRSLVLRPGETLTLEKQEQR